MRHKICRLSLFSGILACVAAMPVDAAVKAKNSNRSYSAAYQQINAMRYEQEYANANAVNATTASATDSLPVAVEDENLAQAIIDNESAAPTMSKLEACSMIYPSGVFKWASPTSGNRANSEPQCVAVIDLRDANSNEVLATTTVAAGDFMTCNIDYFPESGYNKPALSKVKEFPADAAPTMEDVISVMNEEQKQNAGLKIAAAALIGGVAGNFLAPKEAGSSSGKIPLGTGKSQLKGTAIGVTAGAGIMAASTYSGKVAGDTIKSTAVNAASGMIIGNMLAGASGGNGVLATTKCMVGDNSNKTEHDCIFGRFAEVGEQVTSTDDKFYIINLNKEVKECTRDQSTKCRSYPNGLLHIKIQALNGLANENFDTLTSEDTKQKNMVRYTLNNEDVPDETTSYGERSTVFYKIATADTVVSDQHAYAVFNNGVLDKITGYKSSDWDKLKTKAKIYARNGNDSVGDLIQNDKKGEFVPLMRDASSGGLIDMSNEARIKGTVAGTAVGGTLGGIAGYAGAKEEVEQRWLSARNEYENSLTNFVCATGGRFLSKYNDNVEIPTLKESQE